MVTGLPPNPTAWPVWAWDMYVERRAMRECEGETPSDAARNAEEDVRRWFSLGGDAAWVARLTAGPPCPLFARYDGRPGSPGVARKGRAAR